MAVNLSGSIDSPMAGQPRVLTGSLSDVNIGSGYMSSPTRSIGLGSAIIGAGSNILGSILGYKSQKETNRANRELAELQNKWNIEQWKREIAYNHPVEQMKRYEKAGVNPLMALANIEPGNAPNIQSADLANQQAFTDFSGLGSAGETFANIAIAKQNADTARYSADTQRMDVESNMPIKRQQLLNMQQEEKNLKATQNQIVANTQHINQLLSNARRERVKIDKEIDYQDLINNFERQFGAKTRQAQLDNLLADTANKKAVIRQIEFNMKMALKEFEQHVREWKWTRFNENRLFKLQFATTNANIKLINSEIDKNKSLTPQQKKEYKLRNENYWNQRGQEFTEHLLQMLTLIVVGLGRGSVIGNIGKGSQKGSVKPPSNSGEPPVPYN